MRMQLSSVKQLTKFSAIVLGRNILLHIYLPANNVYTECTIKLITQLFCKLNNSEQALNYSKKSQSILAWTKQY